MHAQHKSLCVRAFWSFSVGCSQDLHALWVMSDQSRTESYESSDDASPILKRHVHLQGSMNMVNLIGVYGTLCKERNVEFR